MSRLIIEKENYEIRQIIEPKRNTLILYSYNKLICEYVENPGMGFEYLYKFGKYWNYSKTTVKHLMNFIRNYTRYNFAGKQEIEKCIDLGYVQTKHEIAVMYDKTME